jgi:hypothetical protein
MWVQTDFVVLLNFQLRFQLYKIPSNFVNGIVLTFISQKVCAAVYQVKLPIFETKR